MAESPSSRPTKVIDFQNCESFQVGENTNASNIFHNCIININYNQPPPPTADTVPARDHTTKPYLRQVQGQVKKKAKNNGRSATAQGQGPASNAVKISTQTLVDSEGRVVKPGDAVDIDKKWNYNYGIFVGDGSVVTVDSKTWKVVKVPLDGRKPFRKWGEPSYVVYNSVERVQRATKSLGQEFISDDYDFVWWCYTGEEP